MKQLFWHVNYTVYNHNDKDYLVKFHAAQENVGVYEGKRDTKTKKFFADRLFGTLSATSMDEAEERGQKIIQERTQ